VTIPVTIDYTDPTGAVSSGPLRINYSLVGTQVFVAAFRTGLEPTGRVPGATTGTMRFEFSIGNVRGTTGAFFGFSLQAADGRESDGVSSLL